MKKIIATTNAPAAIGPYSQAIDCGSFLVTSGQVPFDPKTGEFVPGGIHSGIIHTIGMPCSAHQFPKISA